MMPILLGHCSSLKSSCMYPINRLLTLFFWFVLPCLGLSQDRFSQCTAAFLNGKIVVNEYTDKGKCKLSANAQGMLSVCTAELSDTASRAVDKIPFKIAIRDKNTKTLMSFSNETFRELDIRKVLSKCQPGDYIVLLTLSDGYALPHNEILVQ